METIVAVAIKTTEHLIYFPAPSRHHNIIKFIDKRLRKDHIQGFMTSENRFVDREEAKIIATKASQLLPGVLSIEEQPELFSEDLW